MNAAAERTVTLPLLRLLCAFMVFAFPVTILAADEVGSAIFFVLAIAGIIAMFFHAVRLPLPSHAKLIFFSLALFVAVAALLYLIVDSSPISAKKLGRYARFLLVIPLYYLLRYVRIPQQALWYGMAIGAIVAGVTAIYQSWWIGAATEGLRASGSVNSIMFGNLSLLMAIICVSGTAYFWKQYPWLAALPVFAAVMGLLASLLSGSRGGWVALPATVFLLTWFWRKQINIWQFSIAGIVLSIMAFTAYFTPQLGIQGRIETAVHGTKEYFQDRIATSSAGERLDMWKAAWIIFLNHPIFGAGPSGYIEEKQALIDSGIITPNVATFSHPHNEYLAVLATRGLVGFFTLLLLFLLPGYIFFKYSKAEIPDHRLFGISGLISIVAFAHFSLTGDTFDRSLSITFLTFILAVIASLITVQINDAMSSKPL